jgi:hypothetical protein
MITPEVHRNPQSSLSPSDTYIETSGELFGSKTSAYTSTFEPLGSVMGRVLVYGPIRIRESFAFTFGMDSSRKATVNVVSP